MFDFGFSEVLLIFVIALIVLGPEKLPRLASQVGRWVGRARAMARQFREQLEEEVNLEQVRKTQQTPKPAEPEPKTAESLPEPPPSPDPAEFRADTFSHAHPTNEYGANPLTVNGAADPTTQADTSADKPQHAEGPEGYAPGTTAAPAPAVAAAIEPEKQPKQSDNHGDS